MNSESNKKDLVIMRTFNAPREKVWQAWTDPAQIEQWWGPTNSQPVDKPQCPSTRHPWGAYFGMLTDKFGIQWMVSYNYNQQ